MRWRLGEVLRGNETSIGKHSLSGSDPKLMVNGHSELWTGFDCGQISIDPRSGLRSDLSVITHKHHPARVLLPPPTPDTRACSNYDPGGNCYRIPDSMRY